MSTLVFSDTHFSKKFFPRQFEVLKKLISESDKIIINGDFWEGLAISFDDFLKSEWSKLFPLLKEKDTVYVYGNHDDKIFSDNRVYQFCNKAVDEHYMDTPKQKYLFKHGQEFLLPQYSRKRHQEHIKRARTLRMRLSVAKNDFIQSIGFGLFGPKVLPAIINRIPTEVRATIGKSGYLLVCGHTHRPGHVAKNNFLDIGFLNYGWANYLLIDDSGEFKIVSKRY
jgi:UDP-2,3-diacylglucosamine pyrophosphatase LpxH